MVLSTTFILSDRIWRCVFMEVSDLNQNMLILGKFVADIRDSRFSKKCSVREWWFFDEDGVLRHETFGPIDFYGTANKSDRDF